MITRHELRTRAIEYDTWRRHEILGRLNSIGRRDDRELLRRVFLQVQELLEEARRA